MIVVYYGVNLSLSLPFCLSVSLLFPFLVLCLCPNPHFHFLHRSSINLFQPLPLPSASSSGLSISPGLFPLPSSSPSSFVFPIPSASSSGLTTSQSYPLPCFSRSLYVFCLCPDLHSPSLPLAIFLHLELSLSCLFSISRPSVNPSGTPSLSYLSFSSGHSILPLLLLLLLGAILLCSRCSARRKYSLFAPPLDMAKEAICALLAILEHFFEAFSPLDLFFTPAPFRPVPRPFPAFLHPDCRRFPSSAHPVSSSIPTYSISRPSAQVDIIPAWFPSLSETSARAVFIFRASVA